MSNTPKGLKAVKPKPETDTPAASIVPDAAKDQLLQQQAASIANLSRSNEAHRRRVGKLNDELAQAEFDKIGLEQERDQWKQLAESLQSQQVPGPPPPGLVPVTQQEELPN